MSDIKQEAEVVFTSLLDKGIIKVTGDDAEKFLQSLITNDIYCDHVIYALMLSPQGKYLFDFFISRVENSFLLEINKSQACNAVARLKLYKMRSKVEIEDISNNYSVYYSNAPLNIEKVAQYRDPRFDKLGYRAVVPSNIKIEGIFQYNRNLYIDDKYNYAIPEGVDDLIPDKSMPLEYGMEDLNSIDYKKGCYVGQEVISRTKYQGVIRKKIYKIIGENDLSGINQGEAIMVNGEKIGILCSSYKNFGIGLVKFEDYLKHKNSQIYICNNRVDFEETIWQKNNEN